MTVPLHPDDERLAALAGADPEVARDDSLRAHVAGCDRCRSLVEELTRLRAALAELPDLAPPARLRAFRIPEETLPRPSFGGRFTQILRRAMAPAMLAGASIAIVGAVGVSGILGPAGDLAVGMPAAAPAGDAAGGAAEVRATGDESADQEESPPVAYATAPVEDGADPAGSSPVDSTSADPRTIWLALVVGGGILFAAALVLRLLLARAR